MPTDSYKQTIDPETDPERIVAWWMVDSVDLIRIFYQQHLGPSFTDIPAIEIPRPEYIELLNGEDAILADVFAPAPGGYCPDLHQIVAGRGEGCDEPGE